MIRKKLFMMLFTNEEKEKSEDFPFIPNLIKDLFYKSHNINPFYFNLSIYIYSKFDFSSL